MDHRVECLICNRPALPSGEPACDCVTHSLSRPVKPPEHGPDPADVARFPLVTSAPTPPRPLRHRTAPPQEPAVPVRSRASSGAHRKVSRTRFAAATGGAVAAAVVGCTALASLFGGGQSRNEQGTDANPTLALPDGGLVPYEPDRDAGGGSDSPAPGESGEDEASGRPGDDDASGGPTRRPSASATGSPEPTAEETGDPSPTVEPEPVPDETDPAPTATGDPSTSPPPTETEGPTPAVLREGDVGREVVELQKRLRQLNWVYMGEAHGRFDRETRDAVATFQVAYGIQGDEEGVYGTHTRATLEAATHEP